MRSLIKNRVIKRILNQNYVYINNFVFLAISIFPPFIRTSIVKLMLKGSCSNLLLDYKVYFKYPWLVEIGDDVSINRGVEFYSDLMSRSKITIGSNVRVAPNVKLHAGGHDYTTVDYLHTGAPITIGNDCWIGASSIILPGITIGDGAVVAAGSVVSRNVPANTLVAGCPAREVKKLIRQ